MKDQNGPADRITASIIEQLESGVRPWVKPWDSAIGDQKPGLPTRSNGETYKGINIVILWLRGALQGYTSPCWMTYRQAEALGGQVRKGETAITVVYYGQATSKREAGAPDQAEDPTTFRFLKGYPVFNVDQIDGLDATYYPSPSPLPASTEVTEQARIASIEDFITATQADIQWRGDQAFYVPSADRIQLPERRLFRDIEQAYATAAHELVHWTGAKHRLDRQADGRFGSPGYAREELVAELGSAFLGAQLGLRPDHITDHASYLAGWIKVLKSDSRAILKAAGQAQAASDYLLKLTGVAIEQVEQDQAA